MHNTFLPSSFHNGHNCGRRDGRASAAIVFFPILISTSYNVFFKIFLSPTFSTTRQSKLKPAASKSMEEPTPQSSSARRGRGRGRGMRRCATQLPGQVLSPPGLTQLLFPRFFFHQIISFIIVLIYALGKVGHSQRDLEWVNMQTKVDHLRRRQRTVTRPRCLWVRDELAPTSVGVASTATSSGKSP